MSENNKLYAIVPAAGVGSRMKAGLPKQYLKINGKPILEHTVEKLLRHPDIEKVVVAVSDSDPYFEETVLATNPDVIRVSGGRERADSVLSALDYLHQIMPEENGWVLVHDAARPCVSLADIEKLIEEVSKHTVGGILAAPVRDTMKRGSCSDEIETTVDRNNLWHALTPQMFRVSQLREALSKALEANVAITDEASAMEWAGLSPKLVAGRMDNLKVTQPEDLALAEFYLSREEKA